jgi:hypothetical protein
MHAIVRSTDIAEFFAERLAFARVVRRASGSAARNAFWLQPMEIATRNLIINFP